MPSPRISGPVLRVFAAFSVLAPLTAGPPSPPPAVISEIHYHPSDAQGAAEFIELHNPGVDPLDLAGFRLSPAVDFTFPDGPSSVLPPGGYLVVVEDAAAFTALFGKVIVAGQFSKKLANDSEVLRLRDRSGATVTEVEYFDGPPWPAGADGTGLSLELLDPSRPNGGPANWRAGGPTPGARNSVADQVPPIALFEEWPDPAAPAPLEAVKVRVRACSLSPLDQATLFYQVGVASSSPIRQLPLRDDGQGGDEAAGDGIWSATIPPQQNLSVIRYWFEVRSGADSARLPDPKAPTSNFACFAYDYSVSTNLPLYFLFMDPAVYNQLNADPNSDVLRPATFVHDGMVYDRIGVRYRGAWARSWPKKAWKIVFNDDRPFIGRERRINLNSGWHDVAFIREKIAYEIHEMAGALASRTRIVRMHLNGQFLGVYTEIEQPDERFLDRQDLHDAAWYKADSPSNESDERLFASAGAYMTHYRKESREEEPFDDLFVFCRDLENSRTAAQSLAFFEGKVAVENFANYIVALECTQNWDAFDKNHFIGHDVSGIWYMGPWDLDRTLGDHWDGSFSYFQLSILLGDAAHPGITGWNRMIDRFFGNPDLLQRYYERLAAFCLTGFTEAKLNARIDELVGEIGPDVDLDRKTWNNDPTGAGWRAAVTQVKGYIAQRRAFILNSLPGVPPDQPVNLSPAPGLRVKRFPVVLEASPFSSCDPKVTHLSSQWQVREEGRTWGTPYLNIQSDSALVRFSLDRISPLPGRHCYFRVSYTGSNGKTSAFSAETAFEASSFGIATMPIDLGPHFNADVIADPGDSENDGIDGSGRLLLAAGFDGAAANPAARGLPAGGALGYHRLGDPRGPNAVHITKETMEGPTIAIPRGRYLALSLLLGGGGGDSNIPLDLIYEDGEGTVTALCDNVLDDTPRTGQGGTLRAGLVPAIDGMDWWNGSAFEPIGDAALFEESLPVDAGRVLTAVRLRVKGTGVSISAAVTFNLFAITAYPVPGAVAEPEFLRGDVDQDGVVDITDVIDLLFGLFRPEGPFPCPDAADGDDSGSVDIVDPIVILEFLFLSGEPPAAPGPHGCGTDPVPDALGGCEDRC